MEIVPIEINWLTEIRLKEPKKYKEILQTIKELKKVI